MKRTRYFEEQIAFVLRQADDAVAPWAPVSRRFLASDLRDLLKVFLLGNNPEIAGALQVRPLLLGRHHHVADGRLIGAAAGGKTSQQDEG